VAQGFEPPRILTESAAGRADVIRELNWYARKLDSDDEFVLFYSGHGVRNPEINTQGYWVTYGAGISTLDATAIRLSHLMDYVREIKAGKKLVLLDHCFSGDVVSTPTIAAGPAAPAPAPAAGGWRALGAGGSRRRTGIQHAAAPRAEDGPGRPGERSRSGPKSSHRCRTTPESDDPRRSSPARSLASVTGGRRQPSRRKLSMTELITYVSNFAAPSRRPADRCPPYRPPALPDRWISRRTCGDPAERGSRARRDLRAHPSVLVKATSAR
jgi:hypothetical protein